MNSKQRRQSNRNHQHTVVLQQPHSMRYFEWDDHIYTMKVWCNKNAPAGWRQTETFLSAEFSFAKNKDAMMFSLRWS